MSLGIYIFAAIMYIMIIHIVMVQRNAFYLFVTVTLFILGGAMGRYLDSYIVGFVFAAVMSFMFWTHSDM